MNEASITRAELLAENLLLKQRIKVLEQSESECRRTEEALRASEERHRTILQTAMDGIWLVDMLGRLLEVNETYCRMSGYSVQELAGMSIPDLEVAEMADDTAAHIRKVMAQGEDRFESRHRRKDGSIFDVEVSVQYRPDGGGQLITFLRDITVRKRTEESLRQSEQEARRLAQESELLAEVGRIISSTLNIEEVYERFAEKVREAIPFDRIAVNTVNIKDNTRTVSYVKGDMFSGKRIGEVYPLVGAGAEQVVRTKSSLLINSKNREEMKRKFPGTTSLQLGAHSTMIIPLISQDEVIAVLTVHSVHIDAYSENDRLLAERVGSQIAGAIANAQFFLERKHTEEEKAKLEGQLQQAQKMESVGRLAGGVAHDFNNMLGVILGRTEIALDRVDPSDPLHADLTEISKAAGRSADLTHQLLAFARKQTIAPKVLDLNATVANMFKMIRRLIGEDIDLAWMPAAELWPVKIDPTQIDQILTNLCVNARDAISGVGKMTIETLNITFGEEYCTDHAGSVPGEYVLLAVSDDGCGMDKEVLDHLFEPFFTTKGAGLGTGLGLATSYGIVKQNCGFINVYSEPGHGTTFKIYLPRHRGKAQQLRPEGATGAALRGQETILLVEDEPAILEMTTLLLTRQGYTVLAASTPGEAILMAREHAADIHLLMTDVVMPEMNGRDLAKNLLSLYPHLKRLFTSGYTANVIAHHGVLDEGVHFIQKPFSIKGLAAKVREVLDSE